MTDFFNPVSLQNILEHGYGNIQHRQSSSSVESEHTAVGNECGVVDDYGKDGSKRQRRYAVHGSVWYRRVSPTP